MVFSKDTHKDLLEELYDSVFSIRDGDDPDLETSFQEVRDGADVQGIRWSTMKNSREDLRSSRRNRDEEDDEGDDGSEEEDVIGGDSEDEAEEDDAHEEGEDDAHEEEDLAGGDSEDEEEEEDAHEEEEEAVESDLSDERTEVPVRRANYVGEYYDFFLNTRRLQPSRTHVQLTDMIWAINHEEVYMHQDAAVERWSLNTRNTTRILSNFGYCIPTENNGGNLREGFKRPVTLSTFTVKGNLGLEEGLTENYFIHDSGRILVANNDKYLREYDIETFQLRHSYKFPYSVNNASLSPNGCLSAVCLDASVGVLRDLSLSTTPNLTLDGTQHGVAWHPGGTYFATSTTNRQCQIWDVRRTADPVFALRCAWRYATKLMFSSDGRFLVVGEGSDFVTVYSTAHHYRTAQRIDFFGDLAGVSLTPDDESLFIGVHDPSSFLSSLLVYRRHAA